MKNYLKNNKFILACILISVVGVIGFLSPYGHEKWNFIFENLTWFPIELVVTVSVLERIISKKEEAARKNRFIKVSKVDLERSIIKMRSSILSSYLGIERQDISIKEQLELLIEDFDNVFTVDFIKKGLKTIHIFEGDLMRAVNEQKTYQQSYFLSIFNLANTIRGNVDVFINRYGRVLPDDLLDELYNLRTVFQSNIIFGESDISELQLVTVLKAEQSGMLSPESYETYQLIFKELLIEMTNSINNIEEIVDIS